MDGSRRAPVGGVAGAAPAPARSDPVERGAATHRQDIDFRSIVEGSTDLIARFDRDRRHVYVNPAAAAAGALSAEEYVGLTIAESGVPEPAASEWDARLGRALSTGEPVEVVDRFEVGGKTRWFHTRFVPELAPTAR